MSRNNFGLGSGQGTILIVTLWILVILTVFAVALGQRASLEIKLAQYQRDGLRAQELLKAAVERAIWEKKNDPVALADALSESWAKDETIVLDGTALYAMEDELSKINVNEIEQQYLVKFLENCEVEGPTQLANSILMWCGKKAITLDEQAHYETEELPYPCKGKKLNTMAELVLVRGMSAEILEKIGKYLTVYGSGQVNINTASEEVLAVYLDSKLAAEVVEYRSGDDFLVGTPDDRWFCTGTEEILNLEDEPAKNLNRMDDPAPFNPTDWQNYLHRLATAKPEKLCVASNIYTISAQGEVKKVKKAITATVKLDPQTPTHIEYLFWQRQ